jgi:hypothetical protein
MRAGLISPKAGAKLAQLRGTRAQASKMAPFEHTDRDEGKLHSNAGAGGEYGNRGIDRKQHGKGAVGRGQEMPTRSKRSGKLFAPAQRGSSETGGAEHRGGRYAPGPSHVDQFPQKLSRVRDTVSSRQASPTGSGAFPARTDLSTRGRGRNAIKGGVQGFKGNSYGAPNSRP